MPFQSLLYVSDSNVCLPEERWKIRDLVTVSRRWNTEMGVTGSLLFTHVHFSQYIEGSGPAIDHLLGKLRADPRHRNIDIIQEEAHTGRRFDGWSLAYSGPEAFLSSGLSSSLGVARRLHKSAAARKLLGLMQVLAAER